MYNNGRCGMRRLARRRNIPAAFSAIMGRLGKGSQSATRPIFRVHYRKLVDEYSQQEQLKFMPALPDYMSYCCCRCGHTQKFKVSFSRSLAPRAISISARGVSYVTLRGCARYAKSTKSNCFRSRFAIYLAEHLRARIIKTSG